MFNDTDQHVLLESLGVWFVSITPALEKACKHMTKASGIIMSILSRVFEQAQPQQRWLKGVTSVVLANTMVLSLVRMLWLSRWE